MVEASDSSYFIDAINTAIRSLENEQKLKVENAKLREAIGKIKQDIINSEDWEGNTKRTLKIINKHTEELV